jgi:hypothetical protein
MLSSWKPATHSVYWDLSLSLSLPKAVQEEEEPLFSLILTVVEVDVPLDGVVVVILKDLDPDTLGVF